MSYDEISKKYPTFVYQSFDKKLIGETLVIKFSFLISPDIEFKPEITFPNVSQKRLDEIGQGVYDNLIFNIGLVEMLNYWKATCSPQIQIKAGKLSDDQTNWWINLIRDGLGEFYFKNQIDFTKSDLVNIKAESEVNNPVFEGSLKNRDLLLIGGGKDSALTLGIFGELKKDFNCLIINTKTFSLNSDTPLKITQAGGCQNPILVTRTIDPKLLELNQQEYLNGHTPFSILLAFISTLACVLYDFKSIIVSNESSSNEGSVEYLGKNINHQYAKSYEAEKLIHDYIQKYLTAQTNYFSLLRPLNEIEISKLFSKFSKFFPYFRSCNKGIKTGTWCLNCSKCLFTFLMLYPFLGEKTTEVLGENLFEREDLKNYLEELLQIPGKFKPFECVGTKKEVQYALYLSIEKFNDQPLPGLLERYKNYAKNYSELLTEWNSDNLLSFENKQILKGKLNES